jgi:hypothetical protein
MGENSIYDVSNVVCFAGDCQEVKSRFWSWYAKMRTVVK